MRGNEGDIVFSQVGSEANSTILRYMVAMATPCKVSALTYNCLLASALGGQTVDTRLSLSTPTPPRTWARDCLHTIWWSYLKGVLLVLPGDRHPGTSLDTCKATSYDESKNEPPAHLLVFSYTVNGGGLGMGRGSWGGKQ